MDKLGFAPQVGADGSRYRLGLHQCPFREVAQQNQDVVCSLHLGLMQGVLAQMRGRLTVDRLDPLTERGPCIAHLTARDGPGQAAARRYGLTAGRMRNWQCQTVLPDPARGRTALHAAAKVPSGGTFQCGTVGNRFGPTRGTPRRYPK